jgi:16S rRNA (guanine527-N7)-methyltransferase
MSIGSKRPKLAWMLRTGAEQLGCAVSDFQIEQFLLYLAELERWNNRLNLTAITDSEQVVEKHFLDSLAGTRAIEETITPQCLLDIGSGAGFPGLPLKIALPNLPVTLLESSQKKASFLHHIIGKLHLRDAKVLNEKLEDLIAQPTRYDFVVARAFAKKDAVLAKALPLLSKGGRLILYRGKSETELPHPERTGKTETLSYMIPFSNIHRHLEIFIRDA